MIIQRPNPPLVRGFFDRIRSPFQNITKMNSRDLQKLKQGRDQHSETAKKIVAEAAKVLNPQNCMKLDNPDVNEFTKVVVDLTSKIYAGNILSLEGRQELEISLRKYSAVAFLELFDQAFRVQEVPLPKLPEDTRLTIDETIRSPVLLQEKNLSEEVAHSSRG